MAKIACLAGSELVHCNLEDVCASVSLEPFADMNALKAGVERLDEQRLQEVAKAEQAKAGLFSLLVYIGLFLCKMRSTPKRRPSLNEKHMWTKLEQRRRRQRSWLRRIKLTIRN